MSKKTAPPCPRCRKEATTVVEHETFHLGVNKIPVTFVRTKCRGGKTHLPGGQEHLSFGGCGHIFATAEQAAQNQAKLRHALPHVKIPFNWPHHDHNLGD